MITLDGGTGEVFLGEVETIEPTLGGNFARLMEIADKYRSLKVRTNADTLKMHRLQETLGLKVLGSAERNICFWRGSD